MMETKYVKIPLLPASDKLDEKLDKLFPIKRQKLKEMIPKVISWEMSDTGECTTPCNKIKIPGESPMVGSNWCQNCDHNVATDFRKKVVVCRG
jgi:hypothetical protein